MYLNLFRAVFIVYVICVLRHVESSLIALFVE